MLGLDQIFVNEVAAKHNVPCSLLCDGVVCNANASFAVLEKSDWKLHFNSLALE